MRERYTITPRPQHRDVLLQCDGSATLLVVRREGLDMDALTAEARRIAGLRDLHDRVQALATRWEADGKPSGASHGFELSRAAAARLETKRETLRECAEELASALAALDGAS